MTIAPVPPVIPALPRSGRLDAGPVGRRNRPLPLPAVPAGPAPMTDATYALSAVDKSGRVADRSIVRALDWPPGTRLDIRVRTDVVVVCPAADGICMVDDRGYLVMPLAMRRRCHLAAGDRVLLVAHHASGVMVAYPLPTLDRLLSPAQKAATGGERS